MTALIDAQALMWYTIDDPRLPRRAREFIASNDNSLLLSAATVWEMAIKSGLKRLTLDRPFSQYLDHWISQLGLGSVPVTVQHAVAVADLPLHHRDPFDRLLIAQSKVLGVPIVSGDRELRLYDIDLVW